MPGKLMLIPAGGPVIAHAAEFPAGGNYFEIL